MQCQVAVRLCHSAGFVDLGRLEGHLWELGDVEKIRAFKVSVTLGFVCIDGLDIDSGFNARLAEILLV